jgi:predicted permease
LILLTFIRALVRGPEAAQVRLDLEELYVRDRARGCSRMKSVWLLTKRTAESAVWLRREKSSTVGSTSSLMRRLPTAAVHDLADAVRSASRVPAVSLSIVATLAVGLTLMAAAFSAYSAMFLQHDDVPEPERLFEVRRPASPGGGAWSPFTRPTLEPLRVDNAELASMAGLIRSVSARSSGRPVNVALVTGTFFNVVGVSPHRGRAIVESDDHAGAPNAVVVLSHPAWRRLFQEEDRAVGETVIINGVACHIIGVMPPAFRGLDTVTPDFWAPLGLLTPFRPTLSGKEDQVGLTVIARLHDDVSSDAAESRLTAWVQTRADLPAIGKRPKTIRLMPHGGVTAVEALEGLPWFAPLFLTFGLILIIGASNVSNLYLARGFARQKELNIRAALGASRRRLVFLLTVDGFVLALVASTIAFLTAEWWVNVGLQGALNRLVPDGGNVRPYLAAPADWRLMLMLLVCSIGVTIVAALGPALRVTRDVAAGHAGASSVVRPRGKRRFLITVQVASSVVLVVVSSLLLQGAQRAAGTEVVIRVDDTLFVDAPQPSARHAVLATIESTPGVTEIAAAWPFAFDGELANATGAVNAPVNYRFVSPDYFHVLDVPLRKGRFFTDAEGASSDPVAIVSEQMARRLWPDADPIGQPLALVAAVRPGAIRRQGGSYPPPARATAFTVVGVVDTVTVGTGASRQHDAGVYLPVDLTTEGMSFVLRTNGDPELARQMLFDRIDPLDPSVTDITTVRRIAQRTEVYLQAVAALVGSMGAIALILMAGGLAAVMSYLVTHRRQEIGIRLALGATAGDIATSVYAPLVKPIVVGLATGGVLAFLAARGIAVAQLVGMSNDVFIAADPVAYILGGLGVVVVAVFACLIPAARAMRVDPVTTLREN